MEEEIPNQEPSNKLTIARQTAKASANKSDDNNGLSEVRKSATNGNVLKQSAGGKSASVELKEQRRDSNPMRQNVTELVTNNSAKRFIIVPAATSMTFNPQNGTKTNETASSKVAQSQQPPPPYRQTKFHSMRSVRGT